MEIIVIISIVFLIWYFIGLCSMLYYITDEHDLMFDDLEWVLSRSLG